MISLVLNIVALVLFIMAAINIPSPRLNLTATGLAFMVGAILLSGVGK